MFYPNLTVIAAMNYGDEYDTNIEFTDVALRRRMTFIKYTPMKKDAIEFITKHNYHKDLIEVCKNKDVNMLNSKTEETDKNELEQQTTYGSFYSFNQRLINLARIEGYEDKIGSYTTDWKGIVSKEEYNEKFKKQKAENDKAIAEQRASLKDKGMKKIQIDMEIAKTKKVLDHSLKNFAKITKDNYHNLLPISAIVEEISLAGKQYFNQLVLNILTSKFKDLASLKNLNVVKEVIETGAIDEKYLTYKENILLKCMNEIVLDPKLLKTHPKNIIKIFKGRFEYILSLIHTVMSYKNDGRYVDYDGVKAKDKSEAIHKIVIGFIASGLTDEQMSELIDIADQNSNGDDEF